MDAIGGHSFEPYSVGMLNVPLVQNMCHTLRIALPDLRYGYVDSWVGERTLSRAMEVLEWHKAPLQIADYLLAHGDDNEPEVLKKILTWSNSAFTVGVRAGRAGLVRRVPRGVQVAADARDGALGPGRSAAC
jgi:hypothetical protein